MSKRDIWKIRLRPDGTWENVYKDDSIVDRFALEESNRLETVREQFIEGALQQVGCKQAIEIIDRIRYDRTRD